MGRSGRWRGSPRGRGGTLVLGDIMQELMNDSTNVIMFEETDSQGNVATDLLLLQRPFGARIVPG